MKRARLEKRYLLKSLALSTASLLASGCQTFLEVHQVPFRSPEFTWANKETVASLVVLADPSCPQLHGTSQQDRVWWQISGSLKPPIIYGQLSAGATLLATARPLTEDCGPWTVTVTDASLRAESSTFSVRRVTPLPMTGP